MLHRDERKTKEAKQFADGEQTPDAVRQDPLFGQRKGEILYVADTSMITCPPITMGKVQDTKFVQNSQGVRNPQNRDTDLDNANDPVREQSRFYWKDCHDFQTKPEYEEWAGVVQQWEEKMGSVIY